MPITECGICSKEFYIKPSHQKRGWGKFCSTICRSKAQCKGKFVKCFICGKDVYRSPKALTRSKSDKFFCSKSCQTIWRNGEYIGEKSKNWKNGEHAYRSILKRGGKRPTCILCQNTDERVLAVHHKDHNRSNNTLENLTWLCFNCHYLAHHDKKLSQKVMEALV